MVQSVNLTLAKKVYCSNRPKYFFFFASTAELRATFLNLFWTEWASLDGWKISYNFTFWKSK